MSSEHPAPRPAPTGGPTEDTAALSAALGEAIRAVPGVVDLAPSLIGEAARRGGTVLGHRSSMAGQGIEIQVTEAGAVVQVDVVAAAHRPLLDTSCDVQVAAITTLTGHGHVSTSVTVSVLTLRA